MFNKITPEKAGISSAKILKALKRLEERGHIFHGVIMLKGEDAFLEAYWEPFKVDEPHRLYSVTKSYTAIAVGVLVDQGKIDLDKPFISYFPEYDTDAVGENLKKQTIRNMLTMQTALAPSYWFGAKPEDRMVHYVTTESPREPGGYFDYDSEGTFALGCLVEKISGMPLLDFMKKHFLNEIGCSDSARILKCPGGHSWGDSALIASLRDLARFTKLVADKGEYKGKQLISRKYMTEAVSNLSCPELFDDRTNEYGYGYYIWLPRDDSFAFFGMGHQFAIAIPEKELIFVCNSDNQNAEPNICGNRLFEAVYDIFDEIDGPIDEDPKAYQELEEYLSTRKLRTAFNDASDAMAEKINGKTFVCKENPMGWEKFKIDIDKKGGKITYVNAQGEKEIAFGMAENVFQQFPQTGYSDLVGSQPGKEDNTYRCAASAGWHAGNQLGIFVQIIDDYFGHLSMNFIFNNENTCSLNFKKVAEDFLNEYSGTGLAYAE